MQTNTFKPAYSTDTVPGQADDASLSATGTYTVTSDATVIVSSLTTATGATLNIAAKNFIINPVSGTELGVNAGTIRVANGAGFQLGGDGTSFDNTGTISLNSTGKATTLFISASETLYGDGNVVLSDNPNNVITGVFGGSAVFYNYGNTISGAGTIGGNNMTLIKHNRREQREIRPDDRHPGRGSHQCGADGGNRGRHVGDRLWSHQWISVPILPNAWHNRSYGQEIDRRFRWCHHQWWAYGVGFRATHATSGHSPVARSGREQSGCFQTCNASKRMPTLSGGARHNLPISYAGLGSFSQDG